MSPTDRFKCARGFFQNGALSSFQWYAHFFINIKRNFFQKVTFGAEPNTHKGLAFFKTCFLGSKCWNKRALSSLRTTLLPTWRSREGCWLRPKLKIVWSNMTNKTAMVDPSCCPRRNVKMSFKIGILSISFLPFSILA